MRWLCAWVVVWSLFWQCFAMRYDDEIKLGKHGFGYLGKFCFTDRSSLSKTAGTVKLRLKNKDYSKAKSNNFSIALYDDQSGSFHKIYQSGMSCEDKLNASHSRVVIPFAFKDNGKYTTEIDIHEHIRPRWWWAYLVNCQYRAKVKFRSHFTQKQENSWSKELGSNEKGINTLYLVYLILYIALFALQLYSYYVFKVQRYVHQVVKLLTACIGFELLGILFHFVDWTAYTETGERQIACEILGNICEIFASSIFLLLLLVMAQGWTISFLDFKYKKQALGLFVAVFIFKLVFFVWRSVFLDPEKTRYFYNSTPMIVYGGGMLAVGVFFVVLCIRSYRQEVLDSKRTLYLLLAIFFTIWFALPLMQVYIGAGFSAWVRDTAVTALALTWDTVSFMAMMALLWPKWASKFFHLNVGPSQENILHESTSLNRTGGNAGRAGDATTFQSLAEDRL